MLTSPCPTDSYLSKFQDLHFISGGSLFLLRWGQSPPPKSRCSALAERVHCNFNINEHLCIIKSFSKAIQFLQPLNLHFFALYMLKQEVNIQILFRRRFSYYQIGSRNNIFFTNIVHFLLQFFHSYAYTFYYGNFQ